MYKPIRSAELVSGGNVVKQGEYFTLTYQLFDEDGRAVNIAGNTITVKIANNYGVVFESTATILTNGQISFAVNEDIGYGEMRIELTVTNGTTIVQKYPSDGWIKLDVTPSLDDLGYGGVNTVTVASLKNELTQMQNAYKLVVDAEVSEIEGKATDALAKATSAKSTAETVQGEFDRVVAEAGTNNPEVVQARGGEVTLKARLDKTTAQLADKANETEALQQLVPKNYVFGEQLANMKYALSNPLEQFMSIVAIGDSITWGLGATGNPTDYNTGRDGTLSDIRDNFASLSWFNIFKRHIGANYMRNASPVLSNWYASPKGESIVTYTREIRLYPFGGDFKLTSVGVGATTLERALASSLLGRQLVLNVQSAQEGVHTLSFKFTGKEFTLSYDSVDTSMNYELFINGVSKGIFSTVPSVDGNILGSDNRRKHSFEYVKDALIEIKTAKTSYVGVQTLRIAGVIVNKTIRISNQGIIGIKASNYASRALEGNTSGDGVAISSEDNYVFIQLGTNDRIISTDYAKGVNAFKDSMAKLISLIKNDKRQIVLMVASPTANESAGSFSFTMQDVRNTIFQLAKDNGIDMIDNYLIFGDMQNVLYTTDYLHLNDYGNKVMARNIINSLESSAVASNQSEQLDLGSASKENYSTGVWAPLVKGSVTEGSHTYNANTGSYVKIGKLVIAQFYISINSKDPAANGDVRIHGLPFTASTGIIQPIDFAVVTMETGKTGVVANLTPNVSYVLLQQIGSGTGRNPMPMTALANASSFSATLIYVTNQ